MPSRLERPGLGRYELDVDAEHATQTRVCATQSNSVVRVMLLPYSLAREASTKGARRIATVNEHPVWSGNVSRLASRGGFSIHDAIFTHPFSHHVNFHFAARIAHRRVRCIERRPEL